MKLEKIKKDTDIDIVIVNVMKLEQKNKKDTDIDIVNVNVNY